jgi:hypothetical protein
VIKQPTTPICPAFGGATTIANELRFLKKKEIRFGGDSDLTELKLRLVPMKTSWD